MPLTTEERRERQRLRIELGDRGEALALAKLREMGFDAGPTRRNAVEVDIEVYAPGGREKLCDVQVKSRDRYRDWTMHQKHEESCRDDLHYCFVKFNVTAPYGGECWILPSSVVAQVLHETHQAYKKQTRNDGTRRNFRGNYTNRGLGHKYGPEWLDPYRENWGALGVARKSLRGR